MSIIKRFRKVLQSNKRIPQVEVCKNKITYEIKVFEYLAENFEKHDIFLCHALAKYTHPNRDLFNRCMELLEANRPTNGAYNTQLSTSQRWWDVDYIDHKEVIPLKKQFLKDLVEKLKKEENNA